MLNPCCVGKQKTRMTCLFTSRMPARMNPFGDGDSSTVLVVFSAPLGPSVTSLINLLNLVCDTVLCLLATTEDMRHLGNLSNTQDQIKQTRLKDS